MTAETLAPLTGSAPATARAELRALLTLAGPLVGANLLQMAVAAVDVIFVARLGTVELAAATLGVFMFNLLMYSTIGLTTAASPLIAAELGRRKHAVREVRRSFRMALWVGAAAAIVVMIILWNGERLLLLADQDPAVARRSGHFLHIILLGTFPAVAAGVMRTSAAALGRPGWAFGVTGMALAFSIVANWCLVFGNAGFPRLGLEGSALASVLSLSLMAIAYWLILHFDRRLRRYRLFGRWWRSEWSRFREIVRLGLPISLTWMAEGALFGGASLLMGVLGVKEVAAHAVALNIASLTFQVPLGIAQAATIRVGMGYGARNSEWIRRAGRIALAVGTGSMAISALTMWVAPRLLVSAYLDLGNPLNAPVVHLAVSYLAVAAVFQLVDGIQVVAAANLRGLQDTRVPMLVALFGYWVVGFGTAIVLGFRTPLAGVGIWMGLAAGLLVVSILLMWRWSARDRLGLTAAR
ncbi:MULTISPECIES: MATE family efflux transporter [Sphingomonas]|uniref:Multidrug-efflux transporter n=1 Tax=Sphingomonas lycopersici TaxID=2951807 RepID=A0AA41Z857_9SPHN|nr:MULTISPECIES: MATE family efflux transporter [Sphingomonas]MCW6535300.1 MATE family efflux transporter [Sphingomonas lycopersici]OJU17447.1 MAG: MATE family efflux transporter [Sphingomonas sp. 66-10]